MALPYDDFFLSWRERRTAVAHRLINQLAALGAVDSDPPWEALPTPTIRAYLADLNHLDKLYDEAIGRLYDIAQSILLLQDHQSETTVSRVALEGLLSRRSDAI